MKNGIKTLSFILLLSLLVSGCYLIEAVQPTLIPERTPTSLVNLAILPTLPTLAPEATPQSTPVPESNIIYDTDARIFAHIVEQPVPDKSNQAAMVVGTVTEFSGTNFSVKNRSGDTYTVKCDDFCFYVDAEKKIVPRSVVKTGGKVAVYGATDREDPTILNADAIVIDGIVRSETASRTEIFNLPSGMAYKEYELASPPLAAPLRLNPVEGSLDENIEKRRLSALGGRTHFSYGYYGESYTEGLEYAEDTNRDPNFPTRANMTVYSNGYEFFDFWFPHTKNPMFYTWGIVNHGGDWFLPIRMTVDINPEPAVSEIIYSDRTLMSQINYDKTYGYLRTFGFSIIHYNLFYFYQRADGYGFAVNRVDYPLGFDEIIFGLVGDQQDLNPYYADLLITFFGLRGDTWYYVEITAPEETYY